MIETTLGIILVVVPAIVLHECAHGWAALQLGDPTARLMGRLTLNPIRHVDPVGTVLVPGLLAAAYFLGWTSSMILFGWAKPVPVNFARLRDPKRGMMLVALAGPTTNFLLAFLLVQIFNDHLLPAGMEHFLLWGIVLNLGLAFFNLVPIPPLDGSRVVSGLLPRPIDRIYSSLEPFGIVIVVVLLNLGMLDVVISFIYTTANFMGLK